MPTAMRGLPPLSGASPSRLRMSIAVTMRPRRLSMPAISGAASGTRAMRSGANTTCTREIGRPNSWPPMVAVTYSMTLSFALIVSSRCTFQSGGLFLERRDQALPVELGHVVVQADLAAALDRLRGDQHGQTDHGQVGDARIAPYRRGEFEAVHARHVDVGDDNVDG